VKKSIYANRAENSRITWSGSAGFESVDPG